MSQNIVNKSVCLGKEIAGKGPHERGKKAFPTSLQPNLPHV